jgi:pimeloyl-ACP methyl ester carboxylesterase
MRYQGANLNNLEWGAVGAPHTALLVHGLTGRAEAFKALVESLAPDDLPNGPWRLLTPDLRGRGASSTVTGGGGVPEHARDLLALLDGEGLDRVILVGHSMGAMIGVYMAAHHPERIEGLVLVDGGSDVTDEIVDLTAPSIERLRRTYPSREAYLEQLRSQPIFKDRWNEPLESYFSGDVRPGDNGRWHPIADLETIQEDRVKMRGLLLSKLWPHVRCPTLVLLSTVGLAGPEEGFILPPEDAHRMQEIIPDCDLVEVENTNHYDILYSAPPGTVKATRAFLARF